VDYYSCRLHADPQKITAIQEWWTGIETLLGKWAIFHGFAQQDLPIHRGITVVDTEKNQLAWEEEFLVFESADETTIWAKTPSSAHTTIALELPTGKEKESSPPPLPPNEENEIFSFFQDQDYFTSIQSFIQSQTGHQTVQMAEYLETSSYIVISYFATNNSLLDNYLLVTDHKGNRVLHECLSVGQKGLAKGTFQVSNGFLSFVQDKCRVLVYQLDV
jgi:hypothetical protein